MKNWFEVHAAADGTSADINIFGLIGDWIDDYLGLAGEEYGVTTAKSFADALAALGAGVKVLRVHVNSPGGDASNGITIANVLRAQQERGRVVEVYVDGLAASAASALAMGGARVVMADNALMMIHAPWAAAAGNAGELRALADILDKVRNQLVKTYQWHSPLDDAALLALIAGPDGQGTWLDAAEALAAGLATEVETGARVAALIAPEAMSRLRVPEKYAERVAAFVAPAAPAPPAVVPEAEVVPMVEAVLVPEPVAASAEAILAACREADLNDLSFAGTLLDAHTTEADARQLVQAEKERRAAEAARQEEIRAACKLAAAEYMADGYIQGGMPVALVKAQLVAVTAQVDASRVGIDTALEAVTGRRQPVINVVEVYATRNRARR